MAVVVQSPPADAGDASDAGQPLGREDPREEEMATHSAPLAWRIPRTGAWRAAAHGAAQGWTRLSDLARPLRRPGRCPVPIPAGSPSSSHTGDGRGDRGGGGQLRGVAKNKNRRRKSVLTVSVEPHRHEGVFIYRGAEDALVTLNMVPGQSVYGERRVTVTEGGEKLEYRTWNPFRSKLAAAILGGVDQIHIERRSQGLTSFLSQQTQVCLLPQASPPPGLVSSWPLAGSPLAVNTCAFVQLSGRPAQVGSQHLLPCCRGGLGPW